MKQAIAILLTLLMLAALAACAAKESAETAELPDAAPSAPAPEQPKEPEQPETPATEPPAAGVDPVLPADGLPAPEISEPEASNVLVAYFSATGTTAGIAAQLADCLGADLYEIVPEEAYTPDDLNYSSETSRAAREMNDPDARPAISGMLDNMADYETVFLGYPIWWGDAPRIVSTFVESYDFSGKTVIPFCTSGSSGIGSSASNLELLASDATWRSGERLNDASREALAAWIRELGLTPAAQE